MLFLVGSVSSLWMMCPVWLTGKEAASTTIRNLGLVVAAAVGLPLAVWRSVIAERQADAAQRQSETAFRSLLNDRFQKAAEMLGHPKSTAVRIGGINALARLAREHAGDFHLPVARLLTAFLVDRAQQAADSVTKKTPNSTADQPEKRRVGVSTDEQAPGVGTSWRRGAAWELELLALRLDADRGIGLAHALPKEVQEVLVFISERTDLQADLEMAVGFRMNLAGACLPGLRLHDANLSRFDFTNADLRRIRAWGARFSKAVLAGADLSAAQLVGADFAGADMRRVNPTAAKLLGANLRGANLGLVDLAADNLWKGRVFPSTLVCVDLQGADLGCANLGSGDLRYARLAGAKLDECDLTGAELSGADLRAASLKGAKLAGANLKDANLGGVGADLSGADLTGADLTNVNLAGANLTAAFLHGSTLTRADLAHDWRDSRSNPAIGLVQGQLDRAKADPEHPPILDGVLDRETGRPLVWRSPS